MFERLERLLQTRGSTGSPWRTPCTMSVERSSADSTRSERPGSVSTITYRNEWCSVLSTPVTCSDVISSASAGLSGAQSV